MERPDPFAEPQEPDPAVLAELRRRIAERCPNCDHPSTHHSEGGCWYTLTTGKLGRNLVCQCPVTRKQVTDARL